MHAVEMRPTIESAVRYRALSTAVGALLLDTYSTRAFARFWVGRMIGRKGALWLALFGPV
jgi:hypothetical protein